MQEMKTIQSRLGAIGYPQNEIERMTVLIDRVLALKKEKNACLLVHSYQRPEIFEVADSIGDSLALSRTAEKVKSDIIVFCGVHFMAETAKILNPSRTVLLPNLAAGCSLAESAEAGALEARIKELRKKYDDLAVVAYVNTTAAVKALSDTVCTSANAPEVVNALPNKNVLFLPDKNLAAWVAENSDKNIIPWEGGCYVHEDISGDSVAQMKSQHPNAKVLVHPECRTDVLRMADAVLSTAGMASWAKKSDAKEFIIVTECGMSDLLHIEMPDRVFYRSCQVCRFMKSITLEDVVASLEKNQFEITLPEDVRSRAEKAVRRMLELTAAPQPKG
jgi:quinolinate synthase